MLLKHSQALILFAVHIPLVAPAAFAAQDTNSAAIRQTLRQPASDSASLIQVEGLLKCDRGDANTGTACNFTLIESGSGKVYQVDPTPHQFRQAMSMISKKVTITATSSGKTDGGQDVLSIRKIREL